MRLTSLTSLAPPFSLQARMLRLYRVVAQGCFVSPADGLMGLAAAGGRVAQLAAEPIESTWLAGAAVSRVSVRDAADA